MNKTIGIDVYSALHSPRGMGIYTINILKEIAKLDKETTYILYADVEDKNNVLPSQDNFIFKKLNAKNFIEYEQIVLPKQCKKDNINILHSPADTSPIFLDKKIKRFITLHDVIFLKSLKEIPLPNNKKQILGRIYYCLTAILNTKKAEIIFTVSNYSKEDICKTLKINKNKIVITSNGHEHFDNSKATSLEDLNTKYGIPHNYCFCLGGEAPSKNTRILLEIIKEQPDLNIVIAGIRTLESSKLYNEFKNYKNIKFVPYISQEDIVGLYNNAEFFIFPSLYEGFGIPLLEAMKCNCPVITSNRTSIPEVTGEAGIFFNPENKKSILSKIKLIHNNQNLRQEIIEKGHIQHLKYSWETASKNIIEAYDNGINIIEKDKTVRR